MRQFGLGESNEETVQGMHSAEQAAQIEAEPIAEAESQPAAEQQESEPEERSPEFSIDEEHETKSS